MSWDNNPYYQPALFGLESVGEVSLAEPCWSFDLAVIWKHKETGAFYGATDSGCSCPSPFENLTKLEQLDGPFTAHEVAAWLQEQVSKSYESGYGQAAATELISRIMA